MISVDDMIDRIRQEFESDDYDIVLYEINGCVDNEIVRQSRAS